MKSRLLAFAMALAGLFAPAAQAELRLFLDASPGPVLPNEPFMQRVIVHNAGANAVADVSVTIRLPIGTKQGGILAPGASWPGTYLDPGEYATWSIGSLGAGQRGTFWLDATVAANTAAGTLLELTATANASGAPQATETRSLEVGGNVKPLRLAVGTDRETAVAGDLVSYTLRWANASTGAADPQVGALALQATVPAGTTLVSADGAAVDGATVRWTLGAVAARTSGVEHFTVRVDAAPAVDRLVSDAALQDDTGRHADSRRVTPLVAASPLQVFLDASPGPARADHGFTQAVTVRNGGAVALSNVSVSLQNPYGMATGGVLVPAATWPGTYLEATEFATWSLGTLAPGQSRRVQMSMSLATPVAGLPIELHAVASADGVVGRTLAHDFVLADFADPPLFLDMVPEASSAAANGYATYALHWQNRSLTAADPRVGALALEATIPAGTTLVSAPGATTTAAGTLRWNVGTVAPRASGLLRYTVKVNAAAPERLIAEAWLTDENHRLGLVRRTTPVTAPSPLRLAFDVGGGPLLAGEKFTQRVTATNTGSTTLEGVTVLVQHPVGAATGAQAAPAVTWPGTYLESAEFATWAIGNLPAGQSRSLVFTGSLATTARNGGASEFHVIGSATATSDAAVDRAVDWGFASDRPLRLAVTTDREKVGTGEVLTYSLHAANTSQTAADLQAGSLVLEASIPRDATLVSNGGATLTADGTLRWDFGAQPTRADLLRRFSVKVADASTATELRMQAWLVDDNRRLAVAELATPVAPASALRVFLDSTAAPGIGDVPPMQTVTVLNAGATTLESVALQLQSPAYANTSPQTTAGATWPGTYLESTEFATWPLGNLAAGQSRSVSMTAVLGTPPPGVGIELNARASSIAVSDAAAHALLRAGPGGDTPLRLATETDLLQVQPGGTLTYAMNVVNAGTATLGPVALEVSLPQDVTVVAADGANATANGTLRWVFDQFAGNTSTTLRLAVRVNAATTAQQLVSEAWLGDAVGRLASTVRTTPVKASSPLYLQFDATPGPVGAGGQITQNVTLKNLGDDVLEQVQLQLAQPAWTGNNPILSPTTTCAGGCSPLHYAVWSLGNLASGEQRTFQMIATVRSGTNAPPTGTIIEFNAVATALVTTTERATGHVVVGTTVVAPPAGDLIFANGFE